MIGNPDAALAAFDTALAGTPAATELFSVLKSNPPICQLFGEILGGAPRLARTVLSRPHLLDAAIDPNIEPVCFHRLHCRVDDVGLQDTLFQH